MDTAQKVFEPYEISAIIVPGSALLFGLMLLYPTAITGLRITDVQLGSFGLFVVAAFCTGHLLQGLGNVFDTVYWRAWRGFPTNMHSLRGGLAPDQQIRLRDKIRAVLGLDVPAHLGRIPDPEWTSIVAQMHVAVSNAGLAERIEKFNSIYELHRGLVISFVVLTLFIAWSGNGSVRAPGVLLGAFAALVAVYRMHRFGVIFSRELFVQFIQLAETPTDSFRRPNTLS